MVAHSGDDSSSIDRRKMLKAINGSIAAGAIGSMAGCVGGDILGQDDSDISGETVTFVTEETSEAFQNFFETVGQDFEEETGAELQMDYAGVGAGAVERATELVQGGNPPEILMTGMIQATQMLNQDALASLSPSVNGLTDQYGDPGAEFFVRQDDEDYYAPLFVNVGTYWYRTDIYDEAPDTWEKALEQAEQHHNEQGVNGSWVSVGESFCTDLQLYAFAASNDAQFAEWDGDTLNVTIHEGENRDRWIETLEFLRDLHQYSPDNTSTGCNDMGQALATGVSASNWYIGSRPKNNSISQEAAWADQVTAPLQPAPEGKENTTYAIGDGLVSFNGANTQAANEFISFLFQPEYLNQIFWITPFHNLPAFDGIRESDEYQSRIEDEISNSSWTQEDVDRIFEQLDNTKMMHSEISPPNPAAGEMNNTRFASALLFNVIIQGQDPGAALDEQGETLQQLVDENFN